MLYRLRNNPVRQVFSKHISCTTRPMYIQPAFLHLVFRRIFILISGSPQTFLRNQVVLIVNEYLLQELLETEWNWGDGWLKFRNNVVLFQNLPPITNKLEKNDRRMNIFKRAFPETYYTELVTQRRLHSNFYEKLDAELAWLELKRPCNKNTFTKYFSLTARNMERNIPYTKTYTNHEDIYISRCNEIRIHIPRSGDLLSNFSIRDEFHVFTRVWMKHYISHIMDFYWEDGFWKLRAFRDPFPPLPALLLPFGETSVYLHCDTTNTQHFDLYHNVRVNFFSSFLPYRRRREFDFSQNYIKVELPERSMLESTIFKIKKISYIDKKRALYCSGGFCWTTPPWMDVPD